MLSTLSPVIYIKISPELLTIKDIKSGISISDIPEIAISKPPKQKILAVGNQARTAAAAQNREVLNPFLHPRSIIGDFIIGEQVIRHKLREISNKVNRFISLSPHVIINPTISPEGGFTDVELKALQDMVIGAGASRVNLWIGRSLTDQEILSKTPPSSGGQWI